MRKPRVTEAPIVGMIKESETGGNTVELRRRDGISQTTSYKAKSKFGGMEASDVAKMRALEDENRRLKRLLADSRLETRSRSSPRETSDARTAPSSRRTRRSAIERPRSSFKTSSTRCHRPYSSDSRDLALPTLR
jgi:putative transposase